MKSQCHYILGTLVAVFTLLSCAGGETGSAPATIAEGGAPADAAVDHRPARDTVDWPSVGAEDPPPLSLPVDREWPGEEIGLIGPIIAMGGSGSSTFIAIYDPAGVLIGVLLIREAREDPRRLENLLRLARARGAIQNSRTIEQVSARRFLALSQAARQKEAP